MQNILKLKQHFLDDGVRINQPATEKEILLFEKLHNILLPNDLKEYFLLFNGTGEGNFGDSGYAFFSLDELKLVVDESSTSDEKEIYKDCFAFSDYMVWCWGYVIKLSETVGDNPVYSIHLEKPPKHKVANSFSEFINLYLEDPDDVIGCG